MDTESHWSLLLTLGRDVMRLGLGITIVAAIIKAMNVAKEHGKHARKRHVVAGISRKTTGEKASLEIYIGFNGDYEIESSESE